MLGRETNIAYATPSQSPTKDPTTLPTTLPPTKEPTALPTTLPPTIEPTALPTTLPPTLLPTTTTPTANPTSFPPTQFPTIEKETQIPTATTWSPTIASSTGTSSPTKEKQFSFPLSQQNFRSGLGFFTTTISSTVTLTSATSSFTSMTSDDYEQIATLLEPTIAQNLYESVAVGADRIKITKMSMSSNDEMQIEFDLALTSPCTDEVCGDYVLKLPGAYANLAVRSLQSPFLVEKIQVLATENQIPSLANIDIAQDASSAEVAEFDVIEASSAPSSTPPVCEDSTLKFLNIGTERKGCPWVARRKTSKRCELPDARLMCPKTCDGSCTHSPSAAPSMTATQPPTESCDDSTLRFVNVNAKEENTLISCNWVARKFTYKRCKIPTVSSHCPYTCGQCGTYRCEDSDAKFQVPNKDKNLRGCGYFASNDVTAARVERMCRKESFVNTCRGVCGLCS